MLSLEHKLAIAKTQLHIERAIVLSPVKLCVMDDGMKQLRVRFSGVGQADQGGSQTITIPAQQGSGFGRGQTSNEGEYDAAYAATVAAVAYAIAAREEKLGWQEKPIAEKLASQKKPITEKLASQKKPITEKLASRKKSIKIHEPAAASSPKSPPKRGESMNTPTDGSKISRWFSGKEPIEDYDDNEQGANVSVRRPLKPVQKKPEGSTSGQKMTEKVVDSAPSIKKDPSFTRKAQENKGSRKFEQEQAIQKATPEVRPTTSFPRERKESRKFEQEQANSMAVSGEAETMAAAWEKEKLAKIKMQYNETMKTIAEWEAEKKAKARRQKEPKEGDSERKRAKALEEYNDEMKRISKVAAASRLTAEEKRRNAEGKVKEKAAKIRATGKLPQSCGCF